MIAPSFDPGLTQRFEAPIRRMINRDGTFNVHRRGGTWRDIHPYLWLINAPWPKFLGILIASYVALNLAFGLVYFELGTEAIAAARPPATEAARFLNGFFFSAQTLTTLGYGSLAPHGVAANSVAAFEALLGLMGLSLGTGLLFGRISKPSARIGFSDNMLVAEYEDRTSLQFRIVNKRTNSLTSLETTVLMMTVARDEGKTRREYKMLKLERKSVLFFPLTWTIVHPIDEESPLRGMTSSDLEQMQTEFLIMVRGFDETFSQTVHARCSYRYDELIWGGRFGPAFHVDERGDLLLDVDRVGEISRAR